MAERRIGTAGWNVPRPFRDRFPAEGSTLQRFAACFECVEINSTFYRPHQPATFERWAASVPADFRFAVKIPKAISHEAKLVDCGELLEAFLESLTPLGGKLGPLLLQFPPKFAFECEIVDAFLSMLRRRHAGAVVCEPRHATWFEPEADALLAGHRVARVAADPPKGSPLAAKPGGWTGLVYWRLHGSPVIYRSEYGEERLAALSAAMDAVEGPAWCIFDNTLGYAATADAFALQRLSRATI